MVELQTDRQTILQYLHLLSSHIICLPHRDLLGGHFQNVHASDHRLVVIAMALELRTFIYRLEEGMNLDMQIIRSGMFAAPPTNLEHDTKFVL